MTIANYEKMLTEHFRLPSNQRSMNEIQLLKGDFIFFPSGVADVPSRVPKYSDFH